MTPEPLGVLTARALRGAWRVEPPPTTLSRADLDRVVPHLLATGTGALGWRAVRGDPDLAETPPAQRLADAHRLHRLHAGLHDRRLDAVLDLCDGLGIDPLLVKGWTIARRYPERGLRPYGDIDLVLPRAEQARLGRSLSTLGHDARTGEVDLLHAFVLSDGDGIEALNARSRRVPFGERSVRVLSVEDELRLVCLHYLRAGGWRSLSLCDVALVFEARCTGLDWTLVLPDARRSQWVYVAAGLAEDLLGTDLSGTPLDGAEREVPAWARRHVLRGFADTPVDRRAAPRFAPTANPASLLRQARERWPDALELTLHHRRAVARHVPGHLVAYDVAARALTYLTPIDRSRFRDGSSRRSRRRRAQA